MPLDTMPLRLIATFLSLGTLVSECSLIVGCRITGAKPFDPNFRQSSEEPLSTGGAAVVWTCQAVVADDANQEDPVAKQAAPTPPPTVGRRAKRLTAEARRGSILEAARRAFSQTGDMNGTTIRAIADEAGISEGVIYRHFESKDQLFFEAVVEPLRAAVDELVAATEVVDRDEPLSPERQLETLNGLYRQLVATLEQVLPLLGLVLFGDPQVAKRFYRENLAVALDRLAEAWREVEQRYGFEFESPDISARAVMGIALLVALEGRYTGGFDRDRAISLVSEGTVNGFFPTIGT
jgi:AcrR family transcriptional regulator